MLVGPEPPIEEPSIPPVSNLTDPLATARFYVDVQSNASRQANLWRSSRPADAALMERIAQQPQARWFGEWTPDVRASVESATRAASMAGSFAVLVAYNIPQRDCGLHSAGGVANAEAYRRWIGDFAAGIGDRNAVVILEPDALIFTDCLSAEGLETRKGLLRHAVSVLKARPGALVYIDAGNPRWKSAAAVAALLRDVGVDEADGFALNVSNFISTADNIAYGREVSMLTGGKHFVIDTSRNGRGPAPSLDWCNPRERGLGEAPTTETAHPLVDAYLWIKAPGESDGVCNGGPPAGAWWPEYALELARNASA